MDHEPSVLDAVSALLDVAVCQFCGRASAITQDVVDTWLISPQRDPNPNGILIVRCPHHISEWALRRSVAGRTKKMRERAATGRSQALPERRRFDPFPRGMRGAQTR